jgi:hypothetical protein
MPGNFPDDHQQWIQEKSSDGSAAEKSHDFLQKHFGRPEFNNMRMLD